MSKIKAEYIWMDGHFPTQKLRSKTTVINGPITNIEQLPDWGFDGSSTLQAEGNASDCLLKPVYFALDPIRGGDDILVMCEVFNADGTVHKSNSRAPLRELMKNHTKQEPWFGIEQEYTFFQGRSPLGWPEGGYPAPQGPFYCGVGADEVFGREIVEEHMSACLHAGIELSGINAEVMPGQWEFQVGPVGALDAGDQVWMARWLLYRIAEDFGVSATLHPKPVKGDWNGAGAHTNFSTKAMREEGGLDVIIEACEKLSKNHDEHIAVYGAHNEERLTGLHETCSIKEFRYGVSDRGASIRIPMATHKDGKGYLEDRRPSANMDPYKVCAKLIETVCG
ncbi:MAG: glutamine synthetase beta-grasp domain-containing protein [Candidatus Marinimicrobia bacterium]|nr:glutamine synthetase beta-grasp domain-containing protein [Candidatus Neomarinimicrobiota bacterium]